MVSKRADRSANLQPTIRRGRAGHPAIWAGWEIANPTYLFGGDGTHQPVNFSDIWRVEAIWPATCHKPPFDGTDQIGPPFGLVGKLLPNPLIWREWDVATRRVQLILTAPFPNHMKILHFNGCNLFFETDSFYPNCLIQGKNIINESQQWEPITLAIPSLEPSSDALPHPKPKFEPEPTLLDELAHVYSRKMQPQLENQQNPMPDQPVYSSSLLPASMENDQGTTSSDSSTIEHHDQDDGPVALRKRSQILYITPYMYFFPLFIYHLYIELCVQFISGSNSIKYQSSHPGAKLKL